MLLPFPPDEPFTLPTELPPLVLDELPPLVLDELPPFAPEELLELVTPEEPRSPVLPPPLLGKR